MRALQYYAPSYPSSFPPLTERPQPRCAHRQRPRLNAILGTNMRCWPHKTAHVNCHRPSARGSGIQCHVYGIDGRREQCIHLIPPQHTSNSTGHKRLPVCVTGCVLASRHQRMLQQTSVPDWRHTSTTNLQRQNTPSARRLVNLASDGKDLPVFTTSESDPIITSSVYLVPQTDVKVKNGKQSQVSFVSGESSGR